MLLVGLTGGIASGKSTVAGMLADRGAVVIDADAIAREVVEPGTAVWAKIVERFGKEVLLADKRVDRERLAAVVFSDPDKLAVLNEITHPEVMRVIGSRLEELRTTNEIVVADIPLLVEGGATQMFDVVVVVVADAGEQVDRLERTRGMSEEQARARMSRQASQEARTAVADVVIQNTGSLGELSVEVDRLWRALKARQSEG